MCKEYGKWITFTYFELELPIDALKECYHSGSCDDAVEHWVNKVKIEVEPEKLAKELREHGAWSDEELRDHEQNKRRILWIASGNYHDENV